MAIRLVTKEESTPAVASAVSSVVMSAASKSIAPSDCSISVSNSSRAEAVPLIKKSESIASTVDCSVVTELDNVDSESLSASTRVVRLSIAVEFAAIPVRSMLSKSASNAVTAVDRTATSESVSAICVCNVCVAFATAVVVSLPTRVSRSTIS